MPVFVVSVCYIIVALLRRSFGPWLLRIVCLHSYSTPLLSPCCAVWFLRFPVYFFYYACFCFLTLHPCRIGVAVAAMDWPNWIVDEQGDVKGHRAVRGWGIDA